ncbi:MAG: hypothetical protein ABIL22_09555 [candidate division WOR-3 bacterium]
MLQQLNEFKYNAETGKIYIVYFLKFWKDGEDYIVKYQIRGEEKDLFWYGRISKERALIDLKINPKQIKSIPNEEFEKKIKEHLMVLFTTVMKKGLDKGFEEPNTEFVFYKEPFVTKRNWKD